MVISTVPIASNIFLPLHSVLNLWYVFLTVKETLLMFSSAAPVLQVYVLFHLSVDPYVIVIDGQ